MIYGDYEVRKEIIREREIIREYGKFWVDENLNRWSKNIYTYEQAVELSKSVSSSYECENCEQLINCRKCKNTKECVKCTECENCIGCVECERCECIEGMYRGKDIR